MAVYLTKSLLNRITSKRSLTTFTNSDDGEKNIWSNNIQEIKHRDDQPTEMICRVCSGSGCTYLLSKLDDDYDVIAALKSVTNLSVSIEDSLPKYICMLCLDMLKIALTFKKTCELSDRNFRRKLKLTEDPLLHSYPYSKHDFHSILHKMKMKRLRMEAEKEGRRKKIKKEKVEIKAKEFRCASCDVVFDNKEKLNEHRRDRQCMRRACDICGQLVISITQHMKQVHKDDTPHKCSTCGKGFSIIARLRSHMLVHTDTFNFFCDLCPYKCKHKYYLVMHMRTHTGEKPYKCPHCPSTFVNPSNLNKHKLIHRDKQFTCTFCQKSFRTMATLREHTEATHMNIKHTCNYCGKDFCYKSDLRKHEVNTHKREKRGVGGEPTYKQVERQQRMKQHKWNAEDTDITHTNQTREQDPLSIETTTELTTALPTSQFGDTSQTVTSQMLTSQVVTSQLLTSIPAPLLHSTYKVESSGAEVHPVSDYMIYFTDETGVLHQQPTTISIQQPTEIIMSNVPVKDEVKMYPGPHQEISYFQ